MRSIFRSPRATVLVSATFLLMVGCGDSKGTLTGNVLFQNKKLDSGQVTAFPAAKGGVPFVGQIASDGSFSIPNVPYGEYKLTVVQLSARAQAPAEQLKQSRERIKNKQDVDMTAESQKIARPQYLLPEKYADPATSELRVTVEQAENFIELKLLNPEEG